MLFGAASLGVARPPVRNGFPFARESLRVIAREARRHRNWRFLLWGIAWGLTAALFVKLFAASLPIAMLIGAAHGFLGGVAVAMRRP